MSNNLLKPLKKFKISMFLMCAMAISGQCFGEEPQSDHPRKLDLLSKSYSSTVADNVYHWNHDFKNDVQTQAPIAIGKAKGSSLGQRLAAVGLSILVEFATHESFNDLEIQ